MKYVLVEHDTNNNPVTLFFKGDCSQDDEYPWSEDLEDAKLFDSPNDAIDELFGDENFDDFINLYQFIVTEKSARIGIYDDEDAISLFRYMESY